MSLFTNKTNLGQLSHVNTTKANSSNSLTFVKELDLSIISFVIMQKLKVVCRYFVQIFHFLSKLNFTCTIDAWRTGKHQGRLYVTSKFGWKMCDTRIYLPWPVHVIIQTISLYSKMNFLIFYY